MKRRWSVLAGLIFSTALCGAGSGFLAPSASATSASVAIQNFAYSPTPLNVTTNTSVTWTNMDPAPHSVTSDASPAVFDSSPANCGPAGGTGCIQPSGGTFTFTFTTAGTFSYHCRVHSFMHGTIVVSAPAVSVSSVSPSSLGQGAKTTLTVNGAGFTSGATVTSSGTGIAFGPSTFLSASKLTVPVKVSQSAATGARNITVTDSGGASGTCTSCLNLTVGPKVTGASPSSVKRGTSAAVTVSGSGFVNGAKFSVGGGGVTVGAATFVDAGHLSATVTVASTATPGPRKLTVTNPLSSGGGRGSSTTVFSVS
jgi:plastocyanin